jgi:calmodulin
MNAVKTFAYADKQLADLSKGKTKTFPVFSDNLAEGSVIDPSQKGSRSDNSETLIPTDDVVSSPSQERSNMSAWSVARTLTYKMGFRVLDREGLGVITPEAMVNFLHRAGVAVTYEEINGMINQADLDGNGLIDYEEFSKVMMSAEEKWSAASTLTSILGFRVFDQDGSGFITGPEIRQVMAGIGEYLSDEEIEEMIKQADADGNGLIDYEEFSAMVMQAHDNYLSTLDVSRA